jgi:hypothetical protein
MMGYPYLKWEYSDSFQRKVLAADIWQVHYTDVNDTTIF